MLKDVSALRRLLAWSLIQIYLKNICNIFYFDCLTLEDGSDRLLRNVGNYQSTLRYIPEERISHYFQKVVSISQKNQHSLYYKNHSVNIVYE